MRRTAVDVTLVLVFLAASFLTVNKPVSGAAVAENSWVTKAPLHVARSGLGVAAVDGKIYAIGGSTKHGRVPSDPIGGVVGTNEEYDPIADTWVYKSPMPTPRSSFATAVYRGKIYCIGGYLTNGTITGTNEVYDTATDTWENRAPMKTIRTSLEANVASSRIYLIGGYIPAFYTTQNFTATPINEAYDPATDSWSTNTPIPIAVNGYASAVIDNKIYVIGGVSYPEYNFNQIYDSGTDTWSQGSPSPENMAYGPAAATTGINARKRIYVYSQDYNYPEPPNVNSVYDPVSGIWTSGALMPTDRVGFGLAVVNDLLYAIGGSTSSPFDMFWNTEVTVHSTNEQYVPIGYGTPDASYIAPTIKLLWPENKTYYESGIPMNFAVNKLDCWLRYSLDGGAAVDVSANITLSGFFYGSHNLTVYATDEAGNTATQSTVFTLSEPEPEPEPEPFPVVPVAVAASVVGVLAAVGLLTYFKQRKR
jgi:N-acetylneuraminic acid mutarotase